MLKKNNYLKFTHQNNNILFKYDIVLNKYIFHKTDL